MTDEQTQSLLDHIAGLLAANDSDGLRETLMTLLERPGSAASLRALEAAGLLTRIFPELEPARTTDQPNVHFLPVLAHMLETVTAVEWLLDQLHVVIPASASSQQSPIFDRQSSPPVAVQTHPELRYQSVYGEQLREHFAELVGERYPRAALFKLAALLHDVAKPATKETKPDGSVSFHGHQTIGGEIALRAAQRLGFRAEEAGYVRVVVREHMRPGELATIADVTLRAIMRFFRATDAAGPDVLLHLLADHMATRGPNINSAAWRAQAAWIDAMLDIIWGEAPELTPPLVNGSDVMQALGIGPGPLLGQLLAAIGEAQAADEITTAAEAIALARRELLRVTS